MAVSRHPLFWSLSFGLVLFGVAPNLATADESGHSYKVAHSKDGVIHHGVLTIDGSGVGYSEPEDQSDNFKLSCSDFVKGMSLKKGAEGSLVEVPVRWRDRSLRSYAYDLSTENLFQLIQFDCRKPEAARRRSDLAGRVRDVPTDAISYKVSSPAGALSIRDAHVWFLNDNDTAHDFLMPCDFFLRKATIKAASLEVMGVRNTSRVVLHAIEDGQGSAAIYQGIRDACAVQQTEVTRQAALRSQETARLEEQVAAEEAAFAAKRKADFHDGILTALRAAEEPDPFTSIRGDFDLSASDSRQWKTSLQLAGADKCALLKTPPSTPASPPIWTFACMFRTCAPVLDEAQNIDFDARPTLRKDSAPCFIAGGYESMVKSVQSILSLPYQPDEKAVNINQVFFADPSKPARRVFVSKINEATIGVSVVAVRWAGAPADFNAASFLGAPTSLPTEPTIAAEIEAVRNGRYTPLPPIQSTGAPATGNGMAVFEVKNNTPYTLTALFSGPIERRVEVAPRGSISIDLQPGSYKLVGRVNAPNVLPSYGEHVFDASSTGVVFYIQ